MSTRATDNQRLPIRIRKFHAGSDGVMGMPRMHEDLSYEGETASRNRLARLMARDGLFGVPQKHSWQRKRTGVRPDHVKNHLKRNFLALEPNTKWVTDITYIYTAEGVAVSLHRARPVQPSDRRMVDIQDRHMVIKAVLMACWQRPDREPLVLHLDRGTLIASIMRSCATLFAASRRRRSSTNDADRLRKYLARFDLTWEKTGETA